MHKLGERATNCFPKTRESNLEPNLHYHQDLPKEPRFKSTNSKTSYQTRRKGGNRKRKTGHNHTEILKSFPKWPSYIPRSTRTTSLLKNILPPTETI